LPTIQLLLEAWPDSFHEKDRDGMLPLHNACAGGCPDKVIQLLLESWPESMQIVTNAGGFPLHHACRGKLSLTVIQALLQAWPNAVHLPDDKGYLPLHYALKYGCTADVIQFLVHSWPESCHILTNEGELPLHCACDKQSLAVICFMLDCYPQVIGCKDKRSRLPLHTACLAVATLELEVIEHLIQAWPESIQILCSYSCDLDYRLMYENDNYGEDHDSDMEHHDYPLIGNEIDVNGGAGAGGGNDELPINVDNATQGNALPDDLACVWKRKPSREFIRLLTTNNMPPLFFFAPMPLKYGDSET